VRLEAKKYRAFARISLELAEEAETRHIRDGPIELSRIWSKAAFENEKESVRNRGLQTIAIS
jgi:hypothetical protein